MARKPSLSKWLTTKEVAKHFNIPTHQVVRMIHEKRLKAEKIGWQWVIYEQDLPLVWPPPSRKVLEAKQRTA